MGLAVWAPSVHDYQTHSAVWAYMCLGPYQQCVGHPVSMTIKPTLPVRCTEGLLCVTVGCHYSVSKLSTYQPEQALHALLDAPFTVHTRDLHAYRSTHLAHRALRCWTALLPA